MIRQGRVWDACVLCITLGVTGCAQFAQIYVDAKDSGTGLSVPLDLYAADSGLYLGLSPLSFDRTKVRWTGDQMISVVAEAPGFQTQWQVIKIAHWSITLKEAHTPAQQNQVVFKAIRIASCGGG